ncbi:TlpA family protein disulfide reductase [Chitinophaga varians]|uniref:TlpA family protein disulfide reductase n=1 Tax=Chitinophaga varians TaxID=2202339 RepID=A0A847S387_9BACT|nr:TlpA disulfide reductase family protein [Chitinophaga varians]NLR67307.1 TlpA family protein disulfide reductase [Chitinophaga varians]
MKYIFFIALAAVWPARYSFAQDLRPTVTHRLSVGDTVPDISFTRWNDNKIIKLSDFTGQVVILDFWATWCGSCIRMFPKNDSLETQYAGRVKFLLVNSIRSTQDSARHLNNFFHRWQKQRGQPFSLTTVPYDTTAFQLFPHIFLPHYVWISPNRKVIGITDSEAVTAANIRKALQGMILTAPIKGDRYDTDN